jgi:hypothetical protein
MTVPGVHSVAQAVRVGTDVEGWADTTTTGGVVGAGGGALEHAARTSSAAASESALE